MTEIRLAEKNDIPQIIVLWKELEQYHHELDLFFTLRESAEEEFVKFITSLIEENDSCVYIACINDDLIGYVTGTIERYPPVYKIVKFGIIYDMYVEVMHRNNGIGTHLVKKIMEWFKEKDISRVEVRVVSNNSEAVKFWNKNGFNEYIKEFFIDV